ncbi:ABC transporter permease [Nocardia gipuzkoensis]
MQYRINFFLSLLQATISVVTGLVFIVLVFDKVSSLNEWTKPQLVVFYGAYMTLFGLNRMVSRPNAQAFMGDVHRGSLDFLLLRPVDPQVLASVRRIEIWQGADVIVGLAVVAYGVTDQGVPLRPALVLGFIGAMSVGFVILNGIVWAIAMLAFWFINIWQLLDTFDWLSQTGRWPVGIYPAWLKMILTAVIPIGIAVTMPASVITGHFNVYTAFLSVIVGFSFVGVSRLLWNMGLKRYSGASS